LQEDCVSFVSSFAIFLKKNGGTHPPLITAWLDCRSLTYTLPQVHRSKNRCHPYETRASSITSTMFRSISLSLMHNFALRDNSRTRRNGRRKEVPDHPQATYRGWPKSKTPHCVPHNELWTYWINIDSIQFSYYTHVTFKIGSFFTVVSLKVPASAIFLNEIYFI
jgi:hypothetical protein